MLAELSEQGIELTALAFSLEGTMIIARFSDGTVRIWDAVPYRIRFAERQFRESRMARGTPSRAGRAWRREPRPRVGTAG